MLPAVRLVVLFLGVAVILCLIGVVLLAALKVNIPTVLETLGGTAIGALAGILVKTNNTDVG